MLCLSLSHFLCCLSVLEEKNEPVKMVIDLVKKMKDICAPVTHAYFSSYVHRDDFVELNMVNKALFENFLTALLDVAHKLENCTLQTGGKRTRSLNNG